MSILGGQAGTLRATDLSGVIKYDGALRGRIIVQAWPPNPDNRVLQLDGKTGYVRTDLTDLSGSELTIQYWFKGSSMASAVRQQNGGLEDFEEEWSGHATGRKTDVGHGWIVAGWNTFHILSHDGLLNGIQYDPVVTDGSWHHIVLTWKQNATNGFASYVDGMLCAQRDSRNNPTPDYGSPVYFGSYDGKWEFTCGALDEISIWKRFFTGTEVSNHWHDALKGDEPGLVALWNFDASRAVDVSTNHFHGFLQGGASLVKGDIPGLGSAVQSALLDKPGYYQLTNLSGGVDYRVRAFLDVNSNGILDSWEPSSDAKTGLFHTDGKTMTVDLSLGIPVPFWRAGWFMGLGCVVLAALAGASLRFVERAKLRERLETLQRQNDLERERSRIAREIHDELGAKLTRICYLTEAAKTSGASNNGAEYDTISSATHQLLRTLDTIVWAVNPGNDTLENLIEYAAQYADEFFQVTRVKCEVDIPAELPDRAITSQKRHNVLRVLQECLTNALKHSEARKVTLRFETRETELRITISDDGRGFDSAKLHNDKGCGGNGILFMRERMGEAGGEANIASVPGKGTTISLLLPLAPAPRKWARNAGMAASGIFRLRPRLLRGNERAHAVVLRQFMRQTRDE